MEDKDVLLKKLRDNHRFLSREVASDMPFEAVKDIADSITKFEGIIRSAGNGDLIKKRGYVDDSIESSSFCGLLWFTADYSDIRRVCGIREFVEADVSSNAEVSPDGGYSDWSKDVNESPKGNVSVHDGKVFINVDVECPDDALYRVVEVFGLKAYKGSKMKVVKGSYIASNTDAD